MKKKIIIGLVAFFTFVTLTVGLYFAYKAVFCEEIKGRIMVVQRDTQVRRLALIKIYAVSAKNAEAWRLKVVQNCRRIYEAAVNYRVTSAAERRSIIEQNDASIGRLESLLKSATESRDDAREFWIVDPNQPTKKSHFFKVIVMPGFPSAKEIEEDAMASKWERCYDTLRKSVIPELEDAIEKAKRFKEVELSRHDAEVEKRLSELSSEYRRSRTFEALTEIPESVRITATGISDDNGDYSLSLPVGDYYLIARGSRRVYDTDEHYYWARPVSVPSDDAKRCLMGNNNMLGSSERSMWSDLEDISKDQKESK